MKNMKKIILVTLLLFFITKISAQDYANKLSYTLGTGLGLMGDGDLAAFSVENGLTYKLNKYLSSSVSFGIGRSYNNTTANNNYLAGSVNLYISPFRNDKRNNFKIGGGYSYINTSSAYIGAIYYVPDYEVKYAYDDNSYNAFNIIIEDEYWINSRFLVGLKLYTTGNMSFGGIISGGLIKFGVSLK